VEGVAEEWHTSGHFCYTLTAAFQSIFSTGCVLHNMLNMYNIQHALSCAVAYLGVTSRLVFLETI